MQYVIMLTSILCQVFSYIMHLQQKNIDRLYLGLVDPYIGNDRYLYT